MTYRWLEADFVAAVRGYAGAAARARSTPQHTGASWAAGDPLPGVLLSISALVIDRVHEDVAPAEAHAAERARARGPACRRSCIATRIEALLPEWERAVRAR